MERMIEPQWVHLVFMTVSPPLKYMEELWQSGEGYEMGLCIQGGISLKALVMWGREEPACGH